MKEEEEFFFHFFFSVYSAEGRFKAVYFFGQGTSSPPMTSISSGSDRHRAALDHSHAHIERAGVR